MDGQPNADPFHYHFATKPVVHAMAGGRAQRARALAATARGNMPLQRWPSCDIGHVERHFCGFFAGNSDKQGNHLNSW